MLVALFATGVGSAVAWTGPSTAPPGGNTSAPINVSATAQTKSGAFTIGSNAYSPGSYPLSVGSFGSWTGLFNWPNTNSGLGILVGGAYSQFENPSGYYTELANSSYGVLTNGDVCTSGYCLNAVGARSSVAFGGMWEEYSNGVAMVYNPWTGGLSCPGFAPTAREAAVGASGNGVWPFYLYYCTG